VHCPLERPLCEPCLAELGRLRPRAYETGTQLAELLASHVVPDQPWLDSLDATSESICRRVQTLTTDKRLVGELSQICVEGARSRWEQLRQLRSLRR
jgi:hypothetical protein